MNHRSGRRARRALKALSKKLGSRGRSRRARPAIYRKTSERLIYRQFRLLESQDDRNWKEGKNEGKKKGRG